ncbi:MAG: tetratricopeptide repeat protein [Bryobacterales bacterium]|nr:tetratricopeptide repeat protein [Bryobacterales bacterium]
MLVTAQEIETALGRILQSEPFHRMAGIQRFLRFIVTETLAGRGGQIKEYTIGVAVYARGSRFDPRCDTIVRVEAAKLRKCLNQYYAGVGSGDALVISIPKGAYVPRFQIRQNSPLHDGDHGKDPEEIRALGWYLMDKATPDSTAAACEHFWRVVRRRPDDAVAYADLAQASAMPMTSDIWPDQYAPRLRMAAAEAERLNPDNSDVQVARALVAAGCEGNFAAAIKSLRRAIESDPQNPRAYYWSSYIFCVGGQMEDAVAACRKAVRLQPMLLMLRVLTAVMLHYSGRNPEARATLEEVAKIEPDYHLVHFWLGRIAAAEGEHDESIPAARRAAEISPSFMNVTSLATVLAKAGKREEGEALAAELQDLRRPEYISNALLAPVYGALGQHQEAAMRLESARRVREWTAALALVDPLWSDALNP